MAARRRINVFSLSFLDAMTCGFGAVVLFFMIINASFGRKSGRLTGELQGEVNHLEDEVLEGYQNLVELRNSLLEIERENVLTAGLSRRRDRREKQDRIYQRVLESCRAEGLHQRRPLVGKRRPGGRVAAGVRRFLRRVPQGRPAGPP